MKVRLPRKYQACEFHLDNETKSHNEFHCPNHSRQDTATAVVTAAAVGTTAAAAAAAQQQPLPLLLVVQSALVYSASSPPFPRPCIAIARCECDRARALRVQSTVRRLEPLEPPLVSKTKADR